MGAASRMAMTATLMGVASLLAGCGGGSGSDSPSDTTTTTTPLGPSPSPPGPAPAPTPAPGPAPAPTPAPGPAPCPAEMTRGHCTACDYEEGNYTCTACSDPYTLEKNPTDPDTSCTFDCKSFQPGTALEFPSDMPTSHNGATWPGECFQDSTSHFFIIGDWGGLCNWGKDNTCPQGAVAPVCAATYQDGSEPGKPCPMPNRHSKQYTASIDGKAQSLVSKKMVDVAGDLTKANTPPRYVVNVGDNFYPGGVDEHCGNPDMSKTSYQFAYMWKAMYPSPLTDIPWYSVLGNHDYGGICFLKGWDQQIYFTWNSEHKWVMPAQYYKTTIQYSNFDVDMFFVDGNIFDAKPGLDENHDICSPKSNPGDKCETANWPPTDPSQAGTCGKAGPSSVGECHAWFDDLWTASYNFLLKEVPASKADWQFVVNHYPPQYNLGTGGKNFMDWSKWLEPSGVDLYISGHTHEQKVFYLNKDAGLNMGKTAWVISGGGGGVTSENIPVENGEDDGYGFMDVEISLQSLVIKAYSHGGVDSKTILRSETIVHPVEKKSDEELLAMGFMLKPTPVTKMIV